jgi:hypothetical protein
VIHRGYVQLGGHCPSPRVYACRLAGSGARGAMLHEVCSGPRSLGLLASWASLVPGTGRLTIGTRVCLHSSSCMGSSPGGAD